MKLTDSQLVILSSAAKRGDNTVLPLPRSMKLNKDAVEGVLKILLKRKLISEREAAADDTHWREKGERRFALIINEAGLKAVGIEKSEAEGAKIASPPKSSRRKQANLKQSVKRSGSKLSVLVGLFSRADGGTLEEAVKATGWQRHSVRGAISGGLKKKMGLTVTSAVLEGRGRVYRIGRA